MLVTTVGKEYNRPTSANSIPNKNDSANIKQNLKTEIGLYFILSSLRIVLFLPVIGALLVTNGAVGNKLTKHCAPSFCHHNNII
jgi:hypothetical protein